MSSDNSNQADTSEPDKNAAGERNKSENDRNAAPEQKPLDSIRAMYAALRARWVPPAKDSARRGMEYTIRFAFKRDGELRRPSQNKTPGIRAFVSNKKEV